jgi:hypothetical protein
LYEDFEVLLQKIHENRMHSRRRASGYLSQKDVPAVMRDKYEKEHLSEVVSTMATTRSLLYRGVVAAA